jgi:hypothetical protein
VPPLTNLVIADSGFGCVKLIVAGAKVGLAYICSIKQAHANFSKDYIKEHFKDAPSPPPALIILKALLNCWTKTNGVLDGTQ